MAPSSAARWDSVNPQATRRSSESKGGRVRMVMARTYDLSHANSDPTHTHIRNLQPETTVHPKQSPLEKHYATFIMIKLGGPR